MTLRERIPVEHLKVRQLPRLERTELLAKPDALGAEERAHADHVEWRHTA